MILKTLTLINFRKFKNTTIEFPDGVTGIVGLNGTGKSTVFEAIAWVLYGPVAARTPADQIKRQGSEKTQACRVELEFIFEEERYRVVREMKGKSLTPSATATINGKIAATSAETVTRFIQKKLGMDFKSFFTSIYAKQKELNTLSSMNASERRPLILRMLGINSLDDVIKEIRQDKKTKDNIIEKIDDQIIDKNGEDKQRIFKDEIKKIEQNKKKNIEEIKKIKEKIKDTLKTISSHKKNYEKNKKTYEKLNEKKEKIAEKKIKFEQKRKLLEEKKLLDEKIKNRQKIIKDETEKLKKYKELEDQIKKTETQIKNNTNKIESYIKSIENKRASSEKLQKDKEKIKNKENKIKKLGSSAKCPTCERVLADQYDNLLNKFKEEIIQIQKEIKSYEDFIKKESDGQERIKKEQIALEKKLRYLNSEQKEKQNIEQKIKYSSNELNQEQKELEKNGKELSEIGLIVYDEKEFILIKKQIEKIYKDYQKSLDLLNEKKEYLNNQNLNIEKKQGEDKLFEEKIKNYNEKINQIIDLKNQLKQEKNTVRYLSILNDIMNDFRTYLISRIRPTLSDYSSGFFNSLTDGKYSEVELDDNYNLMIYDNGEKYNIDRFSGGEEDLANLCLRLSISEVITERAGGVFNVIILDEIFGSQDNLRRHNIMKSLNSLSGKFRQIFLITHIEDVKNEMENILYVTENENGISNIVLR